MYDLGTSTVWQDCDWSFDFSSQHRRNGKYICILDDTENTIVYNIDIEIAFSKQFDALLKVRCICNQMIWIRGIVKWPYFFCEFFE